MRRSLIIVVKLKVLLINYCASNGSNYGSSPVPLERHSSKDENRAARRSLTEGEAKIILEIELYANGIYRELS